MLKVYLRQAIRQLKEHPLFSLISILGITLSITMVMVIMLVYQVTYGDYKPETNRSRTLYIKSLMLAQSGGSFNSSYWDVRLAKECFSSLQTPEAISFVSFNEKTLIETTDKTKRVKGDYKQTDAAFWNIFKFRFLEGKPFKTEDKDSNIKPVIISEAVAERLFSSAQAAIGQSVLIGRKLHTICGVVENTSPLATSSYAEIWAPYSGTDLTRIINEETTEGMSGKYQIVLLAHSTKDFPAIRSEVEQQVDKVNKGFSKWQIDLLNQPDSYFVSQIRVWANIVPDTGKVILSYAISILILLLVPAMNLSGLSATSMQSRSMELGVRKAFGATSKTLYLQVLTENLIITLLGGIAGLGCSYITVFFLKEKLFSSYQFAFSSSDITLNMDMLFQPVVFIYALLFCFVLNLLSAGIPAWNATRQPIVNSLKQQTT